MLHDLFFAWLETIPTNVKGEAWPDIQFIRLCRLCIKAAVVVVPPGCYGGDDGLYDLLPSGMWIAKGEG